jgi:hypothetical protein
MPVGVIRASLLAAVLALLVADPTWARPKPDPCPDRRYVVTAGTSLLTDGSGDPVILAFAEDSIAAVGGCSPTRQRIRVKRNGTRIQLRWKTCDTRSDVRLKATLATSCDAMLGKVRARRLGAFGFGAVSSVCGDGVLDAGGGETCDVTGCDPGQTCASCRCVGGEDPEHPKPSNCVIESVGIEGFNHVAIGTDVAYASNPPSSGNHYPVWSEYDRFTETVPRGYWVHNLEHGAIVLLHRPDAGSEVIDALDAAYAAIPLDPKCTHRRAVMTPDPLMPQPFAVVSWGWRLTCDVVDEQAILDFVAVHRDAGRESICAEGGFNP